MKDVEIIGMLKTYVAKCLVGAGALKGAPCTIKSIAYASGVNTLVFEWTDDNGDKQESTMLVYDGAQGETGARGVQGPSGPSGADGYSPTITVKTSTSDSYILTITDKNGSYDTPNLKGSGGGGGASAMSDLTDVDLTALANGSVLVYDSTAAKWEATALSFADISDVDLTGITDGQILAWDVTAGKFVPADNTGEEYTAGEGIEISQDNEITSKIVMYTGTKAAWDALPLADKKKYTHASFTDDTESGIVDNVPTENSDNLVKSGGVWSGLESKADVTDLNAKADIATTLAGYGITDAYTKTETGNAISTAINTLGVSDEAVAGSYVTEVSEADGKISVTREAADVTPTANSTKMLTSGGAKTALDAKQDTLTFDNAPTENSNNPVKSGGVYSAEANIYEVMGENGAKNLIPYDINAMKAVNVGGTWSGNEYTYNGITFAVNSDGTITVSGIASALTRLAVTNAQFENGKAYTMTGCPEGGNHVNAYTLYTQTVQNYDDGEGVTFNWSSSITSIAIAIFSGVDLTTPITFKPMIRLASDTDSTYQPYAKTNQQLTAENEVLTNKLNNEIATRSTLGAKNILPFDLADIKALNTNGTWAGNVYTYRGVDFTVNSDGTILADGQATGGNASIKVFAATSSYEMLGKNVILNGCPSGGSATTYRIQAYRMGSVDGSTGTYFDDGDGTIAFDALNNASGTVGSFAVAVYENATVTNLLFKPMVRLATDTDNTYQSYAKTNQELTSNVTAIDNARIMYGVENILPNTLGSGTSATSVTYTRNSDGTVSVSGTAVGNAVITVGTITGLTRVRLTGCPSDGGGGTYQLQPKDITDNTYPFEGDYGKGKNYTLDPTHKYRIDIVIREGYTISGTKLFKPMVVDLSAYSGTTYDDYVPYAKSNRELTDDVAELISDGKPYNFGIMGINTTPSFLNGSILSSKTILEIFNALPTNQSGGSGGSFTIGSEISIGTYSGTNTLFTDIMTLTGLTSLTAGLLTIKKFEPQRGFVTYNTGNKIFNCRIVSSAFETCYYTELTPVT